MASLDELLKEYDEIRSTARFAERIPKAERQELMGNMAETMELGQWPGDERVIKDVEKAKTRAGLAHIKSSRAETLGQVERARNMQTSLADAERQADPPVTDRMKGMVSDILSSVFPDQSPKGSVMDVPSVPNVPKMPAPVASTRPAITPDAIVSAPMPPTAPSVAKKPAVIPEGTFIPQDFPKPNAHNRTELNPDDEEYFQEWYADWAKQLDLNPDPDHPDHHYDYRGAWHAAIDPQPEVNPDTGEEEWHWDSRFKDADHPRAILDTPQGRLDTRTGKILPPLPKAEPSGDAEFEAKNRSFQAFMANQALGGRTPESLGGKNPLDRYPQDDPSKHGFIGQFIEGAKGGAQQLGEAAAGTMQRLQSPDDTTTILGKKVNVGEMLGKIAGGFSEAAKEHAPHPYMQTLPWYRRLSNPEYLGNVLGNAAVATIPSLSSAIVGGVAGGVPGAAAGMMLTTYLQQAGSSYREALESYQKQGLSLQEAHAKAYAVSGVAGLTSGAVNTLSIPASLIEPFKRTLSNLILQYGLNVSIDTADQITQNAIKQQTYKPDQELLESVPETIAASGIFGAPETMVAAKTIATGPAKVTTPSTDKPTDEPSAITPELLGGPPPSTPSVAPSTTPTTPVTTEPILSEDEEINLPEIVVRPTDSPEETKSALESALADAQAIHDSSAEPVTPQAETPPDITPGEPSPSAQPKAIGNMTFDEFLDSAFFYRAGNMGRLKFPDGSGVMLRQNSTAANWKEQDRDFLKGLYDSRALASTKRQQASTPEAIDTTSNFVDVSPTDVQPTAIETPVAEQATAPAPIQSDADKRTLVIQSLQTGKREELQVPSVPRLTPDVLDSPVDSTPAPPSEPAVNAVNAVVNPETPAPIPALTPDAITTTPAPAEIEPEAPPNVQGSRVVSDWVLRQLSTRGPIVKEFIASKANEGFGGTKAQGAYTPKDAFDAVELGVNRFILDRAQTKWSPTVDATDDAKKVVLSIRSDIMDKIPTMGHYRTEEQDEFQQFSTPPDLSYVMNWAANLSPDDTVLEPSAGLGGLAAYAKGAGAEVVTNEFSPRRAELLKELELGRGFTENAEQLHNILPPDVKPTVVVMNPPFSSTAGRITGQRKSSNVLPHLDQALKRLQDGGRLVALIGKPKEGMRGKQTAVEKWIADIPKRYALRARIGLSGKGFKKYGTSFDNQILVVDKIPSTGQPPPIIGEVQDVIDAIGLLKPVRSARLRPQARPAQPSGLPAVEAHGGAPDSGLPTALPARRVGARPRRGDAQSTPEAIVSGVGRHPVELRQPGHSAELSPDQPGRPGAADADTRADSGRTGPAIGEPVNSSSDTPALDRGPDPALLGERAGVNEQDAAAPDQPASPSEAMTDAVYDTYRPPKLKIAGAKPHPGNLVESAAMASTPPPTPTYQPHLPKALVEKGGLSLAQLEAVVYAGQAHAQMLPDGTRRGFYVGDGTGVGKGREISGIILDNFNQGRKKAIWISEKNNLMKSAVRDWSDLGQSEGDVFAQSKAKLDGTLSQPKGILFSTYTTLASGMESTKYGGLKGKEDKKTGKTKSSRLEQIIQWVGPDFDGVLVFDEAHNMANSTPQKTKRGDSTPAASALAAVELQKRLPKARVVYFSATAASRIEALSYADRLGLWGPGTAFPDKNAFIAKIQEGGLAAMEIVARDSKAMGVYLSRSLDYRDVTYGRIEHALTPEQREIYDTVAHAWQIIFNNINLAMEATGAKKNAHARAAARGRFWGSHQRFFNQILTALQMPSVMEDMRAQIDKGNAIVVQLVNTNQATQDRQLERREQDEEDYEELDLTPRENLMEFVQQSFPTQQYEEYVDDNGKKATRPVRDSEGNPVHNSDAIAMRDELLTQLGAIKVPDGPLEFILNSFGPEAVAEITGRTQRLVRVKDELGRDKVVKQKRSRAITSAEAKQFQDDQRKILVFSDAGGTGESYHADKRAKNQRKRIHYLVQPGWRADKAVQGLGRTHRTNEASAPHYVLVTTNLKGHRRFISTIARRLDQLGALTKGQRQTGSSGLIDAKDNLENEYASGAVRKLIEDSVRGQESTVPFSLLKEKMGLDRLIDENGTLNVSALPDVPQFLNRILALEIDEQNAVFDAFYTRMERAVEYAASKGHLDVGMETYRADAVTAVSDQVVYTEPGSGAQTHLIKMDAKHAVSFIPAVTMEQHARFEGFYRNKKSGKMWALIKGGTKTRDNGAVVNEFKAFGIVDGQYHYIEEQDVREKMTPVSKKIGAEEWEQAIAAHPPFRDESLYLLTGTMLPIWDRLPTQNVRVLRVQTTDGVRHLGRELRAADVPAVLKRLGASQNAEVSQDPQTILTAILDKKQTAVLANQWKLQRRKVADEWRVEVTGSSVGSALKELRDAGLVVERIGFETRFFVPTGDRGTEVLENVLRHRPVAEMLASKENAGRLAMDVPTLQGDAPLTPSQRILNNTPYAKRDHTDSAKSDALATAAVGDLDHAADSVRSAGGVFRTGSGATVLGLGFTPSLIRTGRVDLRGRIVRSARDLARLAQVWRDPRFETFRIVYTKDNAIVGQEAVTSRLPGATSLWVEREEKTRDLERRLGDFAEVTNSGFARLTYGMARRMQRIGANGYFLLHNHPSGRPLPSGEDFHVTERITTKVKGFRGHVVIDSGEYGVIDKNLNDRIVSFPATKQGDRLMRPALAHPAIGANVVNVDDLAQLAKSLQNTERSVSVIYAGASASGKGFTVRAIEDVPLNLMLREDEFRGYLRGRASAYGAVGIFTAYRQIRPAVAKELGQVAVRLVRSGDLMDHIQYDTPVRMWDKTEGIEARQDRLARTDGSRVEMPVPAYESVDPNVEERIKAAQSGVGKTGLRAKLREVLDATWRKSTREFEHLPDTAEFSRLRTSLLQLQKQRAISVDRQLRHMHDLMGDLIEEDYNLFERAVILRDLKREADAKHLLPFGYTPETLQRDLERVNAEVSNNMLVEQRLEQRTAHVKAISQRYVKAMGAIGFDVAHKITKEDYFHHQVLEYAREQAASSAVPGTGRKIKTPTGSGFLKRREGSTLDINANYVQAELEVLGKMDYDIHLAEMIATVDEEHNIQPRLKEEARQYNEQAIRQVLAQEGMKGPLNDEWNKIRQKIAMHMSRLKSALNIPALQTLSLDSIQKIAQDSQQVGHDSALGVFKWISRRREFIKTVLGDNFKTWEDLVPDGYTEWQPREGQIFYMADTIPHRLAQQLQERMLAELNVPAEQVKKILALGGKREQYVVPQEVYDTLSTFTPPPSGIIEALSAQVLGTWKAGKLVGPHSVIKYNLRNLTGDLDATFAGNPRALRRAWQAMKELWPVFTKQGTLEGNAKDWYERGGMGTLLQVQEMGDVHDLKIFKALVERRDKGGVMGAVSSVFNKYWETARLSTDFREAILRYANYLEYLNQIKETGKPANYGASIVETVDALKTAQDKAFKLSNELVGAYDRITVTGQHLRKHWIPFWSWKEVNFTRYKQLLKNAMKTNNMPGVARATASRAALSATSFAFRATLLWSMALLWNALFFPDEERDLSERTRNRIHLIIPPGRDEHGKILYLDGIGSLGDLLSWIGLDTAASHLAAGDLLHDRVTLGELVTKMGKQPLNILVQGLNPMLKLPAELAAGKQAFPDVFHPRAIQDPLEYTVQQLTPFGTEYKAATGKPGVPYVGKEALEDLFVSRQDPGWAAYSTWQDIEDKWKARLGKSTFEGARRSPKGQALSQWAQAVRLHDEAAVTKYKQRYIDLGGDLKSMKASIKAMAPLHGLNKDERAYIVGALDSTERASLTKAEAFYRDEIMAILPPMARAEVLGSLLEHGGLSATVIPRQTMPTRKPMAPGMAIP